MRQHSRRVLPAALLAWLMPLAPGIACDNPALHPELAEIFRLREGLAAEPPTPVQLLYKVEGEAHVGSPVRVRLSFWPREPYQEGRFNLVAGPGMALRGETQSIEIPYKGSYTVEAVPSEKGHRYLKVETLVQLGEGARRNSAILLVPVDVDKPQPPPRATSTFGFAGSKLRTLIQGPAPAEP